MTAPGIRDGQDAEDLDVEEVLALVKDGNRPARPAADVTRDPAATHGDSHGHGSHTAPSPEA
ncbi:molybdopterin molybdenumtransferase MoeA, partial [Streptomyces sp. ID05-39B]|nr:molybdopterin molybdenumtransferase MoeA [Streptomyces sp. ID05-39B]